ncbi:MAG: type II secretion system F family protein [Victivallaceae bacterium]|nr:type II secretion system F family protein [Victivallaceae bacterium]
MNGVFGSPFFPAICAMISVSLGFYMIADFLSYVGVRYRSRFIEETAVELDDVLIQLPPGRILDLSTALSLLSGFSVAGMVFYGSSERGVGLLLAAAVGLVVAMAVFPVPRLILRFLRRRRLMKFNEQLEGVLDRMAGSLKAGFSINQALDEIAAMKRSPISLEFRLLTQEMQLGVPLEEAFENMNRRLGSEDFELVTTAILTARQTGGELTAILERLASLIRERLRIQRKLRAMTSMGRLQAMMIGAMPFLLLLGMYYVSPVMVVNFFRSPLGYLCLLAACVLDVLGFLVIRKITTINV